MLPARNLGPALGKEPCLPSKTVPTVPTGSSPLPALSYSREQESINRSTAGEEAGALERAEGSCGSFGSLKLAFLLFSYSCYLHRTQEE